MIIGGGDCGVLREMCKYSEDVVESITMVDIDKDVVETSRKYFPNVNKTVFLDTPEDEAEKKKKEDEAEKKDKNDTPSGVEVEQPFRL